MTVITLKVSFLIRMVFFYGNEGNLNRAREIRNIYQQLSQFIVNPTYEQLGFAGKMRHTLERAAVTNFSNRNKDENEKNHCRLHSLQPMPKLQLLLLRKCQQQRYQHQHQHQRQPSLRAKISVTLEKD